MKNGSANDVDRLWKDPAVRELLAQNEIHLECEPGLWVWKEIGGRYTLTVL